MKFIKFKTLFTVNYSFILCCVLCYCHLGCSSKTVILSSPPVLFEKGNMLELDDELVEYLRLNKSDSHRVKIRTATAFRSIKDHQREDTMFFQIEDLNDLLDRVIIVISFTDVAPSADNNDIFIRRKKIMKCLTLDVEKAKTLNIVKHIKYGCERVGYIQNGNVSDHTTVVAARMDGLFYGGYLYDVDHHENIDWNSKLFKFNTDLYYLSLAGDDDSILKIKNLLEKPLQPYRPRQ